MAEPMAVRVVRPYANEEEFLEAEAWSVTARSLLLIGVAPVPEGTTLRCELRLDSGASLIVAEGIAVKHLEATATRPAGLVVRYKRMSAASSDFIKRAVERVGRDRPASQPEAAPTPPESSGPKAAPPRRSDRPRSTRPSGRPPASAGRVSVSPRGMGSSGDPEAPAARSVSVVPPATRASTVPPRSRSGDQQPPSGRAISSELPATKARRSSDTPDDAAGPQPRSAPDKRRDSSAMQRLRSRVATKPISAPPDREAILSRLKKKPKGP